MGAGIEGESQPAVEIIGTLAPTPRGFASRRLLRRKAIKTADCSLLDSSGRNLLGKVGVAVEGPCRDGVSK